jgi:predicted Rdx family selenoprotein
VYVDEAIIYSNRREGGRLPEDDDIVRRIRDYLSRSARPPGEAGGKGRGKAGEAQAASADQCGCG